MGLRSTREIQGLKNRDLGYPATALFAAHGLLRRFGKESGTAQMASLRVGVDLREQRAGQGDIDALGRGIDTRQIEVDQHPYAALVARIGGQFFQCGGRGDGQILTGHVTFHSLLRHAVDLLPVVRSGKTTGKIREFNPVGVLLVPNLNINRIKHVSPPLPAGLPIDTAQRADGKVFLRMRNGYSAKFLRMLELDVAAGLMRLAPPLRFKPADDLRALHVCNYTQLGLGELSNPWLTGMA